MASMIAYDVYDVVLGSEFSVVRPAGRNAAVEVHRQSVADSV